MTIRLRGHHFLCLLTYVGKGYSAEFIANYDRIVARLSEGEDILIVEGPDDICAPLLAGTDPHCLNASVMVRDKLALRDLGAIWGVTLAPGTPFRFEPAMIAGLRADFPPSRRAACRGCEWLPLCTEIAESDYQETRLRPGAGQSVISR